MKGVIYLDDEPYIDRVDYETEYTTFQEVVNVLVGLGAYQESIGFPNIKEKVWLKSDYRRVMARLKLTVWMLPPSVAEDELSVEWGNRDNLAV